MNTNKEFDTIAAIATPLGQGAIGIVRLSGSNSINILGKVFNGKTVTVSHYMYYGEIHNNGELIDEVMICAMLKPRSYTREDTVEIYAHGGMLVLQGILEVLVKNGARLAEAGEFTKRAFLNGRLNLTQAEAVMDIISASSETARCAGLRQLGGGLSRRIENIRDKILSWLAHIELSIDYPEHEEEAKNSAIIQEEAVSILDKLKALLKTAEIGRVLRDGVKTAIVGLPNVGKSTLLNAILSEDRAIVTEYAGTTRDVLTERVVVGGVPLILMDTAGIRETTNEIEQIGIEKSIEAVNEADLILYVVDVTEECEHENTELLKRLGLNENNTKNPPVIFLLNKFDISPAFRNDNAIPIFVELFSESAWTFGFTPTSRIPISARTGQGLDEIFSKIKELFFSGNIKNTGSEDIITRERHRLLIEKTIEHMQMAINELEMGVPEDLVSNRLRSAYLVLGEILGVEIDDDIANRIFAEFCVGK